MGLSSGLLAAALVALAARSVRADDGDAAVASAFCDASYTASSVCLAQFTGTSGVTFRVAIPDTATAADPFDALLQIESPATQGWAGVGWGGAMTANPLTVAWPNGNGAVVSSRWATGHTLPAAYAGASYRTLAASKNDTHWTLSVLASGVSQWATGKALDPAGANRIAWASSTRAVTNPASNTSAFGYHTARGSLSVDLSTAKVAHDAFDKYVAFLAAGGSSASPKASSSSAAAPAPAPTSKSAAPAPAPTSKSSAPAPAPTSSKSAAPAPAPTSKSAAPAPAPTSKSEAPAPAPTSKSAAPPPPPPPPAPTSKSSAAPPPPPPPPAPTSKSAAPPPPPAPSSKSAAPPPPPAPSSKSAAPPPPPAPSSKSAPAPPPASPSAPKPSASASKPAPPVVPPVVSAKPPSPSVTESITTIISTVYVTVEAPSSTTVLAPPPTPKLPPHHTTLRPSAPPPAPPHPSVTTTIKPNPPPASSASSASDADDAGPTVTVTVIEGDNGINTTIMPPVAEPTGRGKKKHWGRPFGFPHPPFGGPFADGPFGDGPFGEGYLQRAD